MVRIVYIITGLTKSGTETQLYYLVKSLPKNYKIKICTFVDGYYGKKLREEGYDVILLDKTPRGIKQFLKIINNFKPDIVHSFLPHANIFCKICRIFRNFNLITSIRVKEVKYLHFNIFERITDFLSDKTIVNSYVLKDFLTKKLKFRKRKIKVIYNFFLSKKLSGKNIRKELNVEDKKVITTVANFRKQKDYPTAVRTAKELLKYRNDFVFLFVGEGKEKPKIEKMVKKQGLKNNIKFLGMRTDVPELLSQSDIFFLPSLYEGQSNSIIESMFYKCPIVTTNIPENSELLTNNKEAFLVETKNHKKMAEKINSLLENPKLRKTFQEKANKKAKNLFKNKKTLFNYLEIYGEYCGVSI